MDPVQFEQLLSYRATSRTPTLHEMIFDNYLRAYGGDEEKANIAKQQFTDALYAKFVDRRA